MRLILLLCLSLALAVPAAAAETGEYELGGLVLSYDSERWSFERVQEGDPLVARPDVVRATCIDCFRGHGDAFVTISIADIAREESEAVLDPPWARDRRHSSMTVGELTISLTTIHNPCRNYVPSSNSARVAYRGKTYTFRSGVIVGCHGSDGVGRERFEELLRGLHPRAE